MTAGSTRHESVRRPLDGLRVIDLTAVVMGPFASQILGDMGADVIKIESPAGDAMRQLEPARHPGMGGLFINANRSKRSLCLDLKHGAAKAVLLRLAAAADVFVSNVRPRAMARLDLSYDALRAVNPRLIYVSLLGFGQDGAYAARPAYDDLIQGASTLAALFARSTGGTPRYVPATVADRIAGMAAVNAILAAVIERATSGIGQSIDVPMFETMTGFVLGDHLGGRSFVPPLDGGGYARLLAPSRRPYPTRDGHVCALIYTDQHWRSFYALLGRDAEFAADPRLRDLATRTRHIDALYAEVEAVIATRTTGDWLAAFAAADIPALPLHDLESIFTDPHLESIGFFGTEEHPTEGTLQTMRHPATWSRTQPRASRPAPRLGEHGVEVLAEAGFGGDEIAALVGDGVVRLPAGGPETE